MEAVRLHQTHALLSFSSNLCKSKVIRQQNVPKIKINTRMEVVSLGMLAPRKFMKKRRKPETFKSAEDEADQKNWRKLMNEISEAESAVSVLRTLKTRDKPLPRDLMIGTIMRFKQMKKWNLVSEILEWLKTQEWWSFNEKDHLLLITAYGKLGDFNKAERILKYMNDNGYAPSVISYTALMEAYGRSGHYNKAEAIFRRMESSGPEPSPLTYQILLKLFVQGDKFDEAEALFQSLIQNEGSPFKPDQKMFHMIIYMHKKAGNYDLARKAFAQMAERGILMSTVTFNSLMSFETSYKEVSNIYDQMQRSGIRPDVVSYALLIKAYGKARREEEALAVFEEMLDAGVRPSRKAYNILLDAFAVSGMIEEARTVFKSMRRDRCAPDLCSYATMLSAYVNASDMSGAEKFFRRLTQDGFHPNVIIYGTLMKGYAKVNDLDNMMKTYETMRLAGIDANQTIFTTIMDAHGKASDFGAAAIWFKEMVARGFAPDRKARNILLSLAKSPEEQIEARQLAGLPEDEDAHRRHINGLRDVVNDDDDEDDDDDEAEEEYDDDGDDDTRVNSLLGLSSTTVK